MTLTFEGSYDLLKSESGVTEQRASPAAEVLAEVLSFGPRWSRRRATALHRQQRQQEGLDLV